MQWLSRNLWMILMGWLVVFFGAAPYTLMFLWNNTVYLNNPHVMPMDYVTALAFVATFTFMIRSTLKINT